MALVVFSWPGVYFRRWHFCLPETGWSLVVKHRANGRTVCECGFTVSDMSEPCVRRSSCPRNVFRTCVITAMHPRTCSDDTSPWILSICPSLRAAPRTLQRVRTILSALASERKALESRMDFLSPEKHTHSIQYRWHWIKTPQAAHH